MRKASAPYKGLCTEYYDLDKPRAPKDDFERYLKYAKEANGSILEPMCGTGRFFIPLLERGYDVTGFDISPHMLNVCEKRCREKNLQCTLFEASFHNIRLKTLYPLIFIPSGSFGLLTNEDQIIQALTCISQHLEVGGKFVFDIETVKAVGQSHGIWQGSWIDKPDGSKLVLHTLSNFDLHSRVETTLCRYEHWENNQISKVEVESFCLRLYEMNEIDHLVKPHGLIVEKKIHPDAQRDSEEGDKIIFYACVRV